MVCEPEKPGWDGGIRGPGTLLVGWNGGDPAPGQVLSWRWQAGEKGPASVGSWWSLPGGQQVSTRLGSVSRGQVALSTGKVLNRRRGHRGAGVTVRWEGRARVFRGPKQRGSRGREDRPTGRMGWTLWPLVVGAAADGGLHPRVLKDSGFWESAPEVVGDGSETQVRRLLWRP